MMSSISTEVYANMRTWSEVSNRLVETARAMDCWPSLLVDLAETFNETNNRGTKGHRPLYNSMTGVKPGAGGCFEVTFTRRAGIETTVSAAFVPCASTHRRSSQRRAA